MATFDMGGFGSGAVAVAVLAVLVSGCGSNGSPTKSAGSTGTGGASGLPTRSTSIGTVLVSSSGHTVYELDGDTAGHQSCAMDCQAIWPPVTANGSQVIVNGHPAFTFTQDAAAGQTNGQGVQDQWGHWSALDANGNPLTASAMPTASATSSGGYKY